MAEQRYEVKVTFTVTKDGSPDPMFKCPDLGWYDVPYEGVVALEQLMVDFLQGTVDLGKERLGLKGK